MLQAQLTVRVTVPAETPEGMVPHIAGTFNGWNPHAPGYALVVQPDGSYRITLPDSMRGVVEFKFTLGSWETVQTTGAGADVPNRLFTIPASGMAAYDARIAAWRASGARVDLRSTASASVSILSDSFAMPPLGHTRRVWLYLPPGYARTHVRTYARALSGAVHARRAERL